MLQFWLSIGQIIIQLKYNLFLLFKPDIRLYLVQFLYIFRLSQGRSRFMPGLHINGESSLVNLNSIL